MADESLARAYERARAIIERDKLHHLRGLPPVVPDCPGALQDKLKAATVRILAEHEQRRLTNPSPPLPPGILAQGLPLATAKADGKVIHVPLGCHALFIGPTNSGKTTLDLRLIRSARQAGIHVLTYELKQDLRREVVNDPDYRVFTRDTSIAPLRCPPYASPVDHWVDFAQWFLRSQYSGMLQAALLNEAGRQLLQSPGTHSLATLQEKVKSLVTSKDTYARRDAGLGVYQRLENVKEEAPGLFDAAEEGEPIETALDHSWYVSADTPNDISEWKFTYQFVNQAFRRNRARDRREKLPSHLVVMDESLFSLSKEHAATRLSGMNLMSALLTVMREFGLQLLATATSFAGTDPLVLRNAGLIGILPGTTDLPLIAHALGWRPEYTAYAQHGLVKGEVLLCFNGDYRQPIVAQFPPYELDKHVTPEEWDAACARGNHRPATATALPVALTEPTTASAGLRLTPDQGRVVRRVCTGRLAPVSVIASELGLHYQAMDRIKNFGMKTGLLDATPVVIRSGRGGRAVILTGTDAAYRLLGIPPQQFSRGGGVAHTYYLQELHHHISGTAMEVALTLLDGTKKCADLVFRYDPDTHPWLSPFLTAKATTPGEDEPHLSPSALVAIEVEVSDATKTAPPNATNDLASGIDLVLFAVHDNDRGVVRTTLRDGISTDAWHRIGITSILGLLDAVRADHAEQGEE